MEEHEHEWGLWMSKSQGWTACSVCQMKATVYIVQLEIKRDQLRAALVSLGLPQADTLCFCPEWHRNSMHRDPDSHLVCCLKANEALKGGK